MAPTDSLPDLTICDREPIHIPGSIQPHGILFALSRPDLNVIAVSANVAIHVGAQPAGLLGKSIGEMLDHRSFAAVQTAAAQIDDLSPHHLRITLNGAAGAPWLSLLHVLKDSVLLEAKLPQSFPQIDSADLFQRYDRAARRLRNALDMPSACQQLAEEVRNLSGYDRVKVYRFASDWSGEVIAEARIDSMPSFLGLHFPASDIPVQARELYRRNPERQIPDAAYQPVPLVQAGPDPIDLSAMVLRSVSPVHLEYLHNMQVGASMSISILRSGELWGLVACHHGTSHYVPPELRQASIFLSQLVAWQLALVEDAQTMRHAVSVKAIERTLLQDTTAGRDYREGVMRHSTELLNLMQASGMAISRGASLTTLGETPPEAELRDLLAWLVGKDSAVFATDYLGSQYSPAARLPMAAGVLAIPLGGVSGNMMVWFRPEVARTVTWSGDPVKPVLPSPDTGRLSPRLSFNAWTETVRGRSRPWERHEVAAANSLRDMVANIILRRSLELEDMNARLVRSNEELEAFAYVASHDLKEPLRQIETFSTLLERVFDNRTPPGADPRRWFEGIQASSRRLRTLIDDLADYSRLGRHANPFAPCALNDVLEEVKTDLGIQIDLTEATIMAMPLPVIMCDHTQMRQVLQNLIANALKYRHPDRKPNVKVAVQLLPEHGRPETMRLPVLELTVSDNGIGFDEKHRARIFEPFQRLHSADDYEGSGIGLAICRKIIDRHGGTISAASRIGEGSKFIIRIPLRPLSTGTEPPP